MRSPAVTVQIDLARVRQNALDVRARCGVDVIAVLKADAYGLGAIKVARALRDVANEFYFYDLNEVRAVRAEVTNHVSSIVLRGDQHDPAEFKVLNARPVVWTTPAAFALRDARPILSVDTGQQRFGCAADDIDALLKSGNIDEAFTHATHRWQVERFDDLTRGKNLRRHAAGSVLLDLPSARFDAVRPGLALYHDAVIVTTRLIEARTSSGPTGYSGFLSSTGRHGVIPCGYSNGLRAGPCMVNGERRPIVEVGMQTAFVEIGSNDQSDAEVVLLGPDVTLCDIASVWQFSPQGVLVSLCNTGERSYV